jgi:hypothetical protein
MTNGDETVAVLRELQKIGFTDAEFRKMHHMGVGIDEHMKYSAGKKFQQGKDNELLLMKLRRELSRRKGTI